MGKEQGWSEGGWGVRWARFQSDTRTVKGLTAIKVYDVTRVGPECVW